MPIWYVIIPIAVILLIFIIMMPIMKKQGKQISAATNDFQSKNYPIHVYMEAGAIETINEVPEASLGKVGNVYGIELPGIINIMYYPAFTYANTRYSSNAPSNISFNGETGKSYRICVEPNPPKKNDTDVVTYTAVQDNKIVFKSKFYIVVKDITNDKTAKMMRGIY